MVVILAKVWGTSLKAAVKNFTFSSARCLRVKSERTGSFKMHAIIWPNFWFDLEKDNDEGIFGSDFKDEAIFIIV